MRRRPSPALVLSVIAVVLSLTGASVAAIDYARDAGAVDHKSAVGASSSRDRAAGKLVATAGSGSLKGQIPSRFLDLGGTLHGAHTSFQKSIPLAVNLNQPSATRTSDRTLYNSATLVELPDNVTVAATCSQQTQGSGKSDPQTTIALTNTSGHTLNVAHWVGGTQTAVVFTLADNHGNGFNITESNTFGYDIELNGTHTMIQGVFRQDSTDTGPACTLYGYTVTLPEPRTRAANTR
jgi:hypothetical protein